MAASFHTAAFKEDRPSASVFFLERNYDPRTEVVAR